MQQGSRLRADYEITWDRDGFFVMVETELNKVKDGHQQLVLEVIEVKLLDGSHKSLD